MSRDHAKQTCVGLAIGHDEETAPKGVIPQ